MKSKRIVHAAWTIVIGLSCAPARAIAQGAEPQKPGVVLSEILAANRTGLLDEDGRSSDWIELQNRGDAPVDLAGFKVSDDAATPAKWTFPSVILPPGGFLLVWASGKDRHSLPQKTLEKSKLGIEFERTLVRPGDRWHYLLPGPGESGPAKGWTGIDFDDSSWPVGRSGFGYADDDDATVLPEGTTSVFIRRVFQVADAAHAGQLVLKVDFDDGFVAYLNGVRVAAVNSPVVDPDFSTIASNKHEPGQVECFDLVEHASALREGKNVLAIAGLNDKPSSDMSLIPQLGTMPMICHTGFELDAAGGEVLLTDAQGRQVDRVRYPRQVEDRSYGRSRQGPDAWAYFATPSPGAENRFRPFAEPPAATLTFEPKPGFFKEETHVAFKVASSIEGLQVRYTVDGTSPSESSAIAGAPVAVARSTVFRAAAFVGEEPITAPVSGSFFVASPGPMPILSVSMDPADFTEVHMNQNAHGRTSERRSYVEVFGPTGDLLSSTLVGIRLHGGYGRRGGINTKKSYKLYWRKCLGDASLQCSLVPGIPSGAIDEVVLRANFNDRLGSYHDGASFLRDQVLRNVHRDMGAQISDGAWCILYVNMAPKGLYNIVERIDEEFLTRHFGGKKWDLLKTGNEVVSGTRDEWDALSRLFRQKDLAPKAVCDEIYRRVDVPSFTGYMILNLWSQNEDWPQNNWYAARERREGSKWFFLSWDNEWGMGLQPPGCQADSIAVVLSKKGQIRDIFAALLRSEEYRGYFEKEVEKYLAGALSDESVGKHVDREAAAVDAVIPAELRRNAPGFNRTIWRRNVQTLRAFASGRGPFFRDLVHRTMQASPAGATDAKDVRDAEGR